jgi:glycosyltransferase involved in cell wall biosynthesis
MKIGVWVPKKYLQSVSIYYQQVSSRLTEKGVELIPFSVNDPLPQQVDMYWDPTCTGGKNPHRSLLKAQKPLVATVHGAANFALPHRYTYKGFRQQLKGYFVNARRLFFWQKFRQRMQGIITVSHFAKEEIVRELSLRPEIIRPVYHGFDKNLFYPPQESQRDYLFHVSVYQPVKNLEMLLKAYQSIPVNKRPPLLMVVPGFPYDANIPGLNLIRHSVPPQQVAEYMRGARAFLLPSVRESFGLPLIEAMACGTPVITTYGSACEEVTKDVGILCRYDDVTAWRTAMEQIASDDVLFAKLSRASVERAQTFSWDKSAEEHLAFFHHILQIQTS